jgi:clan AA aspartic protease
MMKASGRAESRSTGSRAVGRAEMGHVFVKVRLEGLRAAEEVRMLVDTGATFAAIPDDLAQRLGIPTLKPITITLADGAEVEARAGTVNVEIDGRKAPATVLILGGEPVLGVETLEALGLKVNPETGELEPTRSYTIRA